jgi:hypothetical protein
VGGASGRTADLSAYAFIELFVVLAFLGAWGVLELVCKRLDAQKYRAEEAVQEKRAADVSIDKNRENRVVGPEH